MVFSDSSTKLGLIQDIGSWCFGNSTDDDTTAYPTADRTRNINAWYDRVVSLIMLSDGRWEWDDINQTDLPIATCSLVSDQQDYALNAAVHYKIVRIEILTNSESGKQLDPMSQEDIRGTAMTEYLSTAGEPEKYDLIGNSVFLYPKPNYSKASGLKVYFQRGASYFTASDTTKTPGFNEMFHRILSYGASLDWISINNPTSNKISLLERRIEKLENGIVNFYSNRNKDAKLKIRLADNDIYRTDEGGWINENSVS